MDITYITLDAAALKEKEEIHEFLKDALDFPEYYGNNLDAFYDCLTEISGREVLFELVNESEATEYFENMVQCIYDAMEQNECIGLVEDVSEEMLNIEEV